jgi:hypothetical protein
MDTALKHRLRAKYPNRKIPPLEDSTPVHFDLGELLAVHERSHVLAIIAHSYEARGELASARVAYEDACRQNFHGHNEQRDLQRFLRKHHFDTRPRLRVFPSNLGQPRRIRLSCPPHEEPEALRRLADELEGANELLQARDALHDLYLFNPADAAVFDRARAIERQPVFQAQFRKVYAQRQRALGLRGEPV